MPYTCKYRCDLKSCLSKDQNILPLHSSPWCSSHSSDEQGRKCGSVGGAGS